MVDADTGRPEVTATLIAALRDDHLVAESRPDHDRQVRVRNIVLLGLNDPAHPRPDFSRVVVERPHLLVEWLLGRVGLGRFLELRAVEASSGTLVVTGTPRCRGISKRWRSTG